MAKSTFTTSRGGFIHTWVVWFADPEPGTSLGQLGTYKSRFSATEAAKEYCAELLPAADAACALEPITRLEAMLRLGWTNEGGPR